jgi:hypothetical protein
MENKLSLNQFIDEFYTNQGRDFYSLYDLSEIGFAISDCSYNTMEDLHESYDLFINNRNKWLDEYAWCDGKNKKAEQIHWLKPYIQ